jgi:hypothetical protein
MILTSPSEDSDQTPPVTTTFDPPPGHCVTQLHHRTRERHIDWERVERLYSFVRDRALERAGAADERRDLAACSDQRRSLNAIEAMFAQARQGDRVVVECAITFFRARAMRDAHHPEFLGEWLGSMSLASRPA